MQSGLRVPAKSEKDVKIHPVVIFGCLFFFTAELIFHEHPICFFGFFNVEELRFIPLRRAKLF